MAADLQKYREEMRTEKKNGEEGERKKKGLEGKKVI